MIKNITLVIPSYRSKKFIINHLKNLSSKLKIIIIENSFDKKLEQYVKKNYLNVDIYLKKNIGFGRAINFASQKVKTKFFFVINPDTIINVDSIKKLLLSANKIKNFGCIGPINKNSKNKFNKIIFENKKINGQAMLFETKTFKKVKGFDESYFLYYEENDFFKKCHNLRYKLYLITNSYYNHTEIEKNNHKLNLHSTFFKNIIEKNSTYCVGGWHGEWSKFYFIKKHYGFICALIKCCPRNIINLISIFILVILNPKKAKYKYYKFEGFLCALIGLPSYKRSIFDKTFIY